MRALVWGSVAAASVGHDVSVSKWPGHGHPRVSNPADVVTGWGLGLPGAREGASCRDVWGPGSFRFGACGGVFGSPRGALSCHPPPAEQGRAALSPGWEVGALGIFAFSPEHGSARLAHKHAHVRAHARSHAPRTPSGGRQGPEKSCHPPLLGSEPPGPGRVHKSGPPSRERPLPCGASGPWAPAAPQGAPQPMAPGTELGGGRPWPRRSWPAARSGCA